MKNNKKENLKEKLNQVKNSSPKVEYAFGPLDKSNETKIFESIVSASLSDREHSSLRSYKTAKQNPMLASKLDLEPENIKEPEPNYKQKIEFFEKDKQLWVNRLDTDEKINVTELMKKVNLNHVKLPDLDLQKYEDLYENSSVIHSDVLSKKKFIERIENADLTQQEYLPKLSHAEMLAINSYTSENYTEMNGLLRGNIIPKDPVKTMMDIAISSQGLNKVPTIELPIVTRYQSNFGLKKLQNTAINHEVEEVRGFISTAFESQKNFGSVQIIYENVNGKSISALSKYPYEREYLLPPNTQIQYTGHKVVDGKHIFSAQGANVLLDEVYVHPQVLARAEIDAKINELSNKFKETRQLSNKEFANLMIDSAKIAHKHNLINDNILNKYIKMVEEAKLSEEFDKDKTFRKLGIKDKCIFAISKMSEKIGLKSLSTKLENQISFEGKKTLEIERKMKQLFEKVKNIGFKVEDHKVDSKAYNLKNMNKSKQDTGISK